MPCTPPPTQLVITPAAWVAVETGDDSPDLGAGFRAEVGAQLGSCTAAETPSIVHLLLTGDVARWGSAGELAVGVGLAVEKSVAALSDTSFVDLRLAASAGNRYADASGNHRFTALDDLELGVRWRLDALPLILGADLFDVPSTHADVQLGLALSVGGHL